MPGQARGHNRSLVLQSLYSDGPQSRADLARVTALTPVTIGALVSDLLAEGLAVELGTRTASRVGKPATLVGFDPAAAHIVSIDLSPAQRMRGAVLDLNGTILASTEVDRAGKTGAAAVDLVTDLAQTLVTEAERPVLGVGVGSPGVVNPPAPSWRHPTSAGPRSRWRPNSVPPWTARCTWPTTPTRRRWPSTASAAPVTPVSSSSP